MIPRIPIPPMTIRIHAHVGMSFSFREHLDEWTRLTM